MKKIIKKVKGVLFCCSFFFLIDFKNAFDYLLQLFTLISRDRPNNLLNDKWVHDHYKPVKLRKFLTKLLCIHVNNRLYTTSFKKHAVNAEYYKSQNKILQQIWKSIKKEHGNLTIPESLIILLKRFCKSPKSTHFRIQKK